MYGPSGHTIVVNCEFTIYISNYPNVENSVLYYDGSSKTPVFTNYDESQLDISGTYSATNVGEYSVRFTPKDGYGFSDGAASKEVTWGVYYSWKRHTYTTTTTTTYVKTLIGTYGCSFGSTDKYYKQYDQNGMYLDAWGTYERTGSSADKFNRYSDTYKYRDSSMIDLYELCASTDSNYDYMEKHYRALETPVTSYTKSETYDIVHNLDSSAYPTNGRDDTYWYVKNW